MGSVRGRRWSVIIFWIILISTSETDGQKSIKETAEKITKILKKDGSTLKPKLLTGKKSQRQIGFKHSQFIFYDAYEDNHSARFRHADRNLQPLGLIASQSFMTVIDRELKISNL